MQQGAMQFVDDYLGLKAQFPHLTLSKDTAAAQLKRFLRHPSKAEARYVGDIPHGEGFAPYTRDDCWPIPIACGCWRNRSRLDGYSGKTTGTPAKSPCLALPARCLLAADPVTGRAQRGSADTAR